MEQPGKKLKKTLLIVGVTGVVYVSFKYLLPLVIPFLISYMMALALRPSAMWIQKKLSFQFREKQFYLPYAVIGGVQLLILSGILGLGVYYGGRRMMSEFELVMNHFPEICRKAGYWIENISQSVEKVFQLPEGSLSGVLIEMENQWSVTLKEKAVSGLFLNSAGLIRNFLGLTVIVIIIFIGITLSMQEMEHIRYRRDHSIFRKEFLMLGNRLISVGKAYIKTQGIIMFLVILICTGSLFVMKNPYYILLGLGIGILDALPIFGTGTILVPWALIEFFQKHWGYGIVLMVLYFVCYVLRNYMETKLMGGQVGLTPMETLTSMYIGFKLFGVLGFILGPIGLLIIEDMVQLYCEGNKLCE